MKNSPKQYKANNEDNENYENIIELEESCEEEAADKRGKKQHKRNKEKKYRNNKMIEKKLIPATKESSGNSVNINDENNKIEFMLRTK